MPHNTLLLSFTASRSTYTSFPISLNFSDICAMPASFSFNVAAQLRGRVALGKVGGVRRDLVGDHAFLDVVAVGQAEVLLRRHIAEHGATEPADHGGADARGEDRKS